MAGVILQLSDVVVRSDDSERVNPSLVVQETEFGGTVTTPSSGASLSAPVRIVLNRSTPSGAGTSETLFDASKSYKITIEEL